MNPDLYRDLYTEANAMEINKYTVRGPNIQKEEAIDKDAANSQPIPVSRK